VCRQPWAHVSEADRTQLLSKIRLQAHVGSDFGLDDSLFYQSFVRNVTEMEAPVSAADVEYSMHGLLAAGGAAAAHLYAVEEALDREEGGDSSESALPGPGGSAGKAAPPRGLPIAGGSSHDQGKPTRRWTECFALAYDSLFPNVSRHLGRGGGGACTLLFRKMYGYRHSSLFHEGLLRYRGLARAIARVSFASKDRVARGKLCEQSCSTTISASKTDLCLLR